MTATTFRVAKTRLRNRAAVQSMTGPRVESLEGRLLLSGFEFKPLAALGDPAPGDGASTFDFEPYEINERGQVAFGADLTTGGEGIFLHDRDGHTTLIARSGDPAPGTGTTYGPFFSLTTPVNNRGDVAFDFPLEPLVSGSGDRSSAVFRFSGKTGEVTPVFVPGVTRAPGGGVFAGAVNQASLNDRGDLAFGGLVTDADIDLSTPPGFDGLGAGIFVQKDNGRIVSVVRPGDRAPGGGRFDHAETQSINDRGDVAFGAHVAGEECIDFGAPQSDRIFCATSVYFKKANGKIVAIAHQGDPVPDSAGGGTYRLAFGPVVNHRGQVAFLGDLTEGPEVCTQTGLFLWEDGETITIARPGDALPGGGTVTTAGCFVSKYDLNGLGQVTFTASSDTDADGAPDATGVYQWSRGSLRLVARTGSEIPGVGTIVHVLPPDLAGCFPDCTREAWIGAATNDRGQVLFTATVDDGGGALQGVLLVATPAVCRAEERDHMLRIKGDKLDNTVSIEDDGAGNIHVTSDCGIDGDFHGIRRIAIETKAGDDTVSYRLTDDLERKQSVKIELGDGQDSASIDASGVVISKNLKIDVEGGDGMDQVTAAVDVVLAEKHLDLELDLEGGPDDDTIDAAVVLAGVADDVEIDIDGNQGADILSLALDDSAAAIRNLDADLNGVTPLTSHPSFGRTQAELAGAFWQWALSLPADHHPLTDSADCSAGQSGKIWFLGGSFAATPVAPGVVVGEAERDCTVPVGKALFFPLVNTEESVFEFEHFDMPGDTADEPKLHAFTQNIIDHARGLEATVDGDPVQNLDSYRVQSPLFTWGPLPENNILQSFGIDAPAGTTTPAVSDGNHLLLQPLAVGQHTVHFAGSLVFSIAAGDPFDFTFSLDITYHLTVAP